MKKPGRAPRLFNSCKSVDSTTEDAEGRQGMREAKNSYNAGKGNLSQGRRGRREGLKFWEPPHRHYRPGPGI